MPEDLMLIYLIIYSTGLRISEALTIKSDALFKNSTGCFIKTYSEKMTKEQYSIISIELFMLLNAYINKICVSNKTEYVFKSKKNPGMPLSYASFRENIIEQFDKMGITTARGDKYRVDVHGYRHRLATEMHEHRISPFIIQKTLHHESIEMTMAYIDMFEKDIKNSYQQFFDMKGNNLLPDPNSERIILSYLDNAFNMQALPNGICTLPVKLKKCEHANACLTCGYFGTSAAYLGILRDQLLETNYILEEAVKNDWIMQIATNQEVKRNLEDIIAKLEVSI